jgi:hypothetical protein
MSNFASEFNNLYRYIEEDPMLAMTDITESYDAHPSFAAVGGCTT